MSLNSEFINNLPSGKRFLDKNHIISIRTGPLVTPNDLQSNSDLVSSRRIKTQFDGSQGNSSTNFASKVLGLKQSAGKSSAYKTEQPEMRGFIKATQSAAESHLTEEDAVSNRLAHEQ